MKLCAFRCLHYKHYKSEVLKSNSWKVTSFSKTTLLQSEQSHNVLYHQKLSITRYQVRFYANNYFE